MDEMRTSQNLLKAFAGESQARNRYHYYAKIAKKEGYEQIAGIFEETALHELSHAKSFFKHLDTGDDLEITSMYPAGRLGTTIENLEQSIKSEFQEWSNLYKVFAEEAADDHLPKIEALFKNIAKVEEGHEKRFRKILKRLEEGSWFTREEEVPWMCRKCGYIHIGKTAPKLCPACFHPQGYFEVIGDSY